MDYPYDLGRYSRKVTASSAQTQRWIDRGLNWCFLCARGKHASACPPARDGAPAP